MLDRVGDGIVHYGISEGYFEKSDDPLQFLGSIVTFFTRNGYLSKASVEQDGHTLDVEFWDYRFLPLMRKLRDRNSYLVTCPICLASNAVTKSVGKLSERVSENLTEDGNWALRLKIVPGTEHTERSVIPAKLADLRTVRSGANLNETIGTQAFESVAYGLAYGFEFLGAQAQLLLDNVGKGMIEFMHEELNTNFPTELDGALNLLSIFMSKNGLADAIHPQLSKDKVTVDFERSRYLPVLKRLLQENRELVSCPFTLAARSLIKMRGSTVGEMGWDIEGDNVRLKMTTLDLKKQEFDEEAVGNMMGGI